MYIYSCQLTCFQYTNKRPLSISHLTFVDKTKLYSCQILGPQNVFLRNFTPPRKPFFLDGKRVKFIYKTWISVRAWNRYRKQQPSFKKQPSHENQKSSLEKSLENMKHPSVHFFFSKGISFFCKRAETKLSIIAKKQVFSFYADYTKKWYW